MWTIVVIYTIMFRALASGAGKKTGHGTAGDMSCPAGQVFAVTNFNENGHRLEMRCVPALICGKPGTKIGSPRLCKKDGEFMARADEAGIKSGNVIESCNKYKLPPKDDYEEICVTLLVKDRTTKSRRHRRRVIDGEASFQDMLSKQVFHTTNRRMERRKRAASSKADVFVGNVKKHIEYAWYVKDIARQPKQYKIVGCQVICHDEKNDENEENPEDSDFYKQYRSEGKVEISESTGLTGSGSPGCFSADTIVETMNGPVRMEHLKAGDKVMTYSTKLSIYAFDEVQYFMHREPETMSSFVTIQTRSGRLLTLTPKHLIPVGECQEDAIQSPEVTRKLHMAYSKAAQNAKVGQCVMAKNSANELVFDEIVAVSSKRQRGIFAPVTRQGNILANSIHASCFSEFEDYAVLRAIFGVYQAFLDAIGNSVMSSIPDAYVELPSALRVLLEAGKLFG